MQTPLFTAQEFFTGMFPECYVFALKPENGGQTAGYKPTLFATQSELETDFTRLFSLNRSGYGIHFTPNAIKTVEGKNTKENFAYINSWWMEWDSEDTKKALTDVDLLRRTKNKENFLSALFQTPNEYWPSLTVETRNGYHVYWLAKGDTTVLMFDHIQNELCKKFSGDPAAKGIMHSLRVPYFEYSKQGEIGKIVPVVEFSSLKLFSEQEMIAWLGDRQPVMPTNQPLYFRKYLTTTPLDNIFSQPVQQILERLSGTSDVNGDVFTFRRASDHKLNVFVNGNSSPNWIDTNKNMIFSNNQPKFCNIIHFLQWYGKNYKDCVKILLQFNIQ